MSRTANQPVAVCSTLGELFADLLYQLQRGENITPRLTELRDAYAEQPLHEPVPADLQIVLTQLERVPGGGSVHLSTDEQYGWACAIEFGREADDSPMTGGAAYGLGASPDEALADAVDDTGWRPRQGAPVARCRVCGCTDADCRVCIELTGSPCRWVQVDLCSACSMPCPMLFATQPARPCRDVHQGLCPARRILDDVSGE